MLTASLLRGRPFEGSAPRPCCEIVKAGARTLARTGDLSNLRHVRRFVILAAAALCISLVAPTIAGARLVPQKGITKIRLGVPDTRLGDRIPKPDTVVRTTGIVSGLPMTVWVYDDLEIEFEGGNTVTRIYTTRVSERTKKGAGVGTSKRRLRKLHPKIRCAKGPSSFCKFGKNRPGRKVTVFDLDDGRVSSITIFRVII